MIAPNIKFVYLFEFTKFKKEFFFVCVIIRTMYKTGIETKQNILDCARKLFYKKGYKQTSVQQICHAADAKLGTFTYYYPKKQDLLSYIYTDYMQKCVYYVESNTENLSPPRQHLYTVMMYYGKLYTDTRITSFHQEVLEIGSMNVWFHNPRVLISGYSGRATGESDDEFYNLCVQADNAVRRELNLDFISQGKFTLSDIRELMHKIYMINARLFQLSQEQTETDLEAAFQFLCTHQDAPIRLL